MPFLSLETFIFTSAKHLFVADVRIDDRMSNLNGNINTKILFPSYHNKNITDDELLQKGVLRAGYDWRNGWDKVARILLNEKEKSYSLKR